MIGLAALAPYRFLAMAVVAAIALGGAYVHGRGEGRALEAAKWQAIELKRVQQAEQERAQLQQAIAARDAEIQAREQGAADAVAQIRVEYLPGKTIVQREVIDRPVFRDCRIGDSVRDTINAALRGAPIAATPGDRGADGVPRGTAHDGG